MKFLRKVLRVLFCGFILAAAVSLGTAIIIPDWFSIARKGDINDVTIENVENSIKITYQPSQGGSGWVGIYWLYPAGNWGNNPGLDLKDAKSLKFSVRSQGDSKAEFIIGGIKGTYSDSIQPLMSTGRVKLSPKLDNYSISLDGKDLSSVIRGFGVVISKENNPNGCTIYLKDMKYEP